LALLFGGHGDVVSLPLNELMVMIIKVANLKCLCNLDLHICLELHVELKWNVCHGPQQL
jgi:hypothetical protein